MIHVAADGARAEATAPVGAPPIAMERITGSVLGDTLDGPTSSGYCVDMRITGSPDNRSERS